MIKTIQHTFGKMALQCSLGFWLQGAELELRTNDLQCKIIWKVFLSQADSLFIAHLLIVTNLYLP